MLKFGCMPKSMLKFEAGLHAAVCSLREGVWAGVMKEIGLFAGEGVMTGCRTVC